VGLSAERAADFDNRISHGIISFLFCILIISHLRGFVNPHILLKCKYFYPWDKMPPYPFHTGN
jgi:hypothetical protein